MEDLDTWETERIAVVGDLHANLTATERVIHAAARDGCDTIVSVGDLGVAWPGDGDRFLSWLDRHLTNTGLNMVFVDGNHEGWPYLAEIRGTEPGRTHQVGEKVTWADRGARWQWRGVTFGALGGAYSIDAERRTVGHNWWPELEQANDSDVQRLVAGGRVDVLICHDAPLETPLVSRWPEGCPAELLARHARLRATDAVIGTDAAQVYHGHWHHRHDTRVRIAGAAVDITGLGSDRGPLEDLWVGVDVTALAPAQLIAA